MLEAFVQTAVGKVRIMSKDDNVSNIQAAAGTINAIPLWSGNPLDIIPELPPVMPMSISVEYLG